MPNQQPAGGGLRLPAAFGANMKKYFTPLAAGLAVLLVAGIAIAMTGGVSDVVGLLYVRGASRPTCVTATSDGDLCVADAIEANGALDVAGTSTLTGLVTAEAGIVLASPSFLYKEIRFCGNGPTGGTETFVSPVPYDDTEADFIDGGAGCDGEDDTTIGTADEPWPDMKDVAFKPVGLVCTSLCTAAGVAASEAVTFRLMDDTAAVAGMTCTTAGGSGDATAQQCTATDSTPATVAAGSLLAIGIDTSGTADECGDAGDDFTCILFVTF